MEWFYNELVLGIIPAHIVALIPPFLFSVWTVNRFMIRPMLRVREERERRTVDARAEAAELEETIKEKVENFEAHMAEARQKAGGVRQEIRAEASKKQEAILTAARGEVAETLDEIRGQVADESQKARKELEVQAEELAKELAEKVLGRSLTESAPKRAGGAQGTV